MFYIQIIETEKNKMAYRMTCEAKNQLTGKLSVTNEKADELLGTELTVNENVYQAARIWALENTATKVQKILYS